MLVYAKHGLLQLLQQLSIRVALLASKQLQKPVNKSSPKKQQLNHETKGGGPTLCCIMQEAFGEREREREKNGWHGTPPIVSDNPASFS
jgi:hypothetical protein